MQPRAMPRHAGPCWPVPGLPAPPRHSGGVRLVKGPAVHASCVELDRFATLVEAMHSAVTVAGQTEPDSAPSMLAILDRDQRLVLAGAIADGAVAWCHPVLLAAEARAVVTEASQLRGQASRAMEWKEHVLALSLRHRADVLEARLVDPLWRAFTARALQVAA